MASTIGFPPRAFDIAIANLLAITLTRTWRPDGTDGFVPNFIDFQEPGGYSTDRSEPQVGAQVLLRILQRHGGITEHQWIVDYLFEPLLGWADWAWDRRRSEGVFALGQPDGLAPLLCLGSDTSTVPPSDGGAGTESGARCESGEGTLLVDFAFDVDADDEQSATSATIAVRADICVCMHAPLHVMLTMEMRLARGHAILTLHCHRRQRPRVRLIDNDNSWTRTTHI